jgi:hypothetical protein
MARRLDLVGKVFGNLKVLKFSHMDKYGSSMWKCKNIITNKIKIVRGAKLVSGETQGKRDHEVHGELKNGKTPSEYISWREMKHRCYNPNHKHFKYYGERGVKVCNRWKNSFSNFLEDMGRRPSPKHSIDRINNNGYYAPDNCRWATRSEQGRNKRNNVWLEYEDIKMIKKDWARFLGVSENYIYRRLKKGKSMGDIISEAKKLQEKRAKNE